VKRLLALGAALAVWLVAAGLPGDQGLARWVGGLLFHLLAALLICWLFVRKQQPRPGLLSPWLFLVAAGIALLGRFNQPA
jgi:thiol:disulfide interchange protein